MEKPAKEDTVANFVQQHLTTLDQSLTMGYIFLSDVRKELGRDNIEYADLAAAAAAVKSNGFDLTPRHPDEYSHEPYLWVTPSPKPAEPVNGKIQPPEKCWIIRSPDGRASRRIKEGLLVFSKPGYATGFMAKQGFGDFNVESFDWADLLKANDGHHEAFILDYVDGGPITVIPTE